MTKKERQERLRNRTNTQFWREAFARHKLAKFEPAIKLLIKQRESSAEFAKHLEKNGLHQLAAGSAYQARLCEEAIHAITEAATFSAPYGLVQV